MSAADPDRPAGPATAPAPSTPSDSDISITVYPDGPLLVRGPVRIQTPDGDEVVNARATRALCRCGKSGLKPWCDGTHKVLRRARRQDT